MRGGECIGLPGGATVKLESGGPGSRRGVAEAVYSLEGTCIQKQISKGVEIDKDR